MSAPLTWQTTKFNDLLREIRETVGATGKAHVYLHDGKWVISDHERNEIADDYIVEVVRGTNMAEVQRKLLRSMLAEVI